MKSQKRLLIILAITVAYGIFDFVINMDQYSKFYTNEKKTKTSLIIPPSLVKNSKTKALLKDRNFTWKRDPFNPLVQKKSSKTKKEVQPDIQLKLKAITHDANNSFVMINDAILTEGESIAGYRVDQIYKDKVKLTKNGKSIYLYPK